MQGSNPTGPTLGILTSLPGSSETSIINNFGSELLTTRFPTDPQ